MLKNPLRSSLRYRDGIPVLPGEFPLVGHLPSFYYDTPEALREAERRLGPLFWIKSVASGWILIWAEREGFELLKNKVVTSREAFDASTAESLVGGESMIMLDGAPHQHVRSATKSPFLPRGLAESRMGAVMVDMIDARVRSWKRRGEITVADETQELALNIIFRIMGIPTDDLAEWRKRYREILLSVFPFRVMLPGFPAYRAEKARQWVIERLRALIDEARRGERKNGEPEGLIAAMTRGRDDEGRALSDKELIDNLRLLVLAGHETSANTMAWIVITLARRPDLWEALVAEADRDTKVPTSPTELRDYTLAEGLFRETVRIYPPVTILSRKSTEWLTLHGHRIPPGTILGVSLAGLCQDPELYADPLRFDPTRWRGRALTPLETAQFGGGPHFCLGYHLAWMEVVQFTVMLAREMARGGLRPKLGPGREPRPIYFPITHPPRSVQIQFR